MKAKVYVTLKPGVLDPQGKAIHHSLELMGIASVADVRQGKYFEIILTANDQAGATSEKGELSANTRAEIERVAREVLSNPVIEDYRVEFDQVESEGR